MQRYTPFAEGEHYHIFNRGVEKRKIFLTERDCDRFIALLYIMNQSGNFEFRNFLRSKKLGEIYQEKRAKPLVSILAYTLMPNHFHLLLHENQEGGITKFMSRLLTAYSMYFNIKNKRSGPLFVRPFRSEHIANERHYMHIFSYIHLNVIDLVEKDWKELGLKNKNKAVTFLNSYKYSSYPDYQNRNILRAEKVILDFNNIPPEAKKPLKIDEYVKLEKEIDQFSS
jgi:putative transposase